MSRPDLMALSPDDLAVLTNRGTVKRAQRKLESGEIRGDLDEAADGEVSARWSDSVECRLPPAKVIGEGRCTCAATELCRHLIRTVLAYQKRVVDAPAGGDEAGTQAEPSGPWDPGLIGDDALAAAFKPAALAKARGEFQQGLLVELVRGAKPSARFHVPPHTVRFLVPGDIRYTHCDCAEPAPCRHVPPAVWAFRMLEPSATAGFVSTQKAALPVPTSLLDDLESMLLEWVEHGTSSAPRAWGDRLTRMESRCRDEDLTWPGEVVGEFAQAVRALPNARRPVRSQSGRRADRRAGHSVRRDPERDQGGPAAPDPRQPVRPAGRNRLIPTHRTGLRGPGRATIDRVVRLSARC